MGNQIHGACVCKDGIWSSSAPYVYINGKWTKCKFVFYDNYAWIGNGIRVDLVDKYLLTSERYNLVTSDMLYLKGRKG